MLHTLALAVALTLSASHRPAAGSALAAALEAVDARAIGADVRFLADAEMAGRDTPSLELELAARFLRSRLARLGFRPGASDGFLYRYGLVRAPLDLAATHLLVRTSGSAPARLAFGRDYVFHPSSIGSGELAGPLVYCGRGRPEELAGLGLTGRFAVCLDSELPWRARRDAAAAAGALGVVVVPDPAREGAPAGDAHARWIERARRGGLRLAAVAAELPPPQLFLERDAARLLLDPAAPPPLGTELAAALVDVRATLAAESIECENVCGLWPGSDPRLAAEVIVLTAHYDHVGVDDDGAIYHGADDNASGTAALLALADGLAAYGPLRRSVLLLWVSGEEQGLLGSDAWARDPRLPDGARAVASFNVDMVGRNAPEQILVTPSAELPQHNGLVRLVERLASAEGFTEVGNCDAYWSRSDHTSLARHLEIPVAFLFAGVHADYHRPSDTADKIDADKVRRVARLVLRVLDELQTDVLDL